MHATDALAPLDGPVDAQQADRIDLLADLDDGWCGHGVGDAPTTAALSAARTLLAALLADEQPAWYIGPDPDGGVRFERDDLPGTPAMVFVDLDRHGLPYLVWFDDTRRKHAHRFTGETAVADCATALRRLLAALTPTTVAPAA